MNFWMRRLRAVVPWVLVAVLVLPFVKAAVQLTMLAAIGLALLFALRQPQEAIGCGTLLLVVGLLHRWPIIGLVTLIALGIASASSQTR